MNPTRVVVAGNSFDDTWSEPFRWQHARGVMLLGDVVNGTRHTFANAISTDGRVICGQSVLRRGFAPPAAGARIGLDDSSDAGGRREQCASV
jgi:uncharacterized membrane protein